MPFEPNHVLPCSPLRTQRKGPPTLGRIWGQLGAKEGFGEVVIEPLASSVGFDLVVRPACWQSWGIVL